MKRMRGSHAPGFKAQVALVANLGGKTTCGVGCRFQCVSEPDFRMEAAIDGIRFRFI